MNFVKNHLATQQGSERHSCCYTLGRKRRHSLVRFTQGAIAKSNPHDRADSQVCSGELILEIGLFLDFLDDKPAHLADPHQMIEGQRSNNEKKHQRCAEESDKLESFSHAEMVSAECKPQNSAARDLRRPKKRCHARGIFLLAQANSHSDGLLKIDRQRSSFHNL